MPVAVPVFGEHSRTFQGYTAMSRDGAGTRATEKLRAHAQRCLRLAETATTPNVARRLRDQARQYEAKAAALEAGLQTPPSPSDVD